MPWGHDGKYPLSRENDHHTKVQVVRKGNQCSATRRHARGTGLIISKVLPKLPLYYVAQLL